MNLQHKCILFCLAMVMMEKGLSKAKQKNAADDPDDKTFWVGPIAGSARLSGESSLADKTFSGNSIGIRGVMDFRDSDWIHELSLGWMQNTMALEASAQLRELNQPLPKEMTTSFTFFNYSSLFKIGEYFEIGPSLLLSFAADTNFEPNESKDNKPNAFIGFDMGIYQFSRNSFLPMSVKYGLQVQHDVTIKERNVMFLHAYLNFAIYDNRLIREKKIEVTKYRDRVKVIEKNKNKFYVDVGVINFETGKSEIPKHLEQYLRSLSQYLSREKNHWDKFYVTSHTDKTGSESLNQRLSQERLEKITTILKRYGISSRAIVTETHTSDEPVQQGGGAVALARNRRVELLLTGSKNMDQMKMHILRLQQRFKSPTTCNRGQCK